MSGIFEDSEGNGSSMNLVWFLSLITIVGTWILLSLKTGTLQHVTGGDALWFTSLFSGKIVQNFYENKKPAPPSNTKSGIIQDSKGKTSPARLIWILCVLGIIATWAWISFKMSILQHFSTGDAAWFTALFGSKVGHTAIERGGFTNYGDGDSDESEGFESSRSFGGSDGDKDKLISQLQETVKVQTEFNKNLVETINPKKDYNSNKSKPIEL
jgi:hypothetical protein